MKIRLFILLLAFALCDSHNTFSLPNNWFGQFIEACYDLSRDIRSELFVAFSRITNNLSRFYDKYVLNEDDVLWDTTEELESEYDFVVVGAGSAGSVVAARLSEIFSWSVLVIEAGVPENDLVDIPLLAVSFQRGLYDWGYVMEPQDNACLGLVDRRMPCPRGKAIGGSSVLNYMIYSRGTMEDYDELERRGNDGWSYYDVLPYFLKSEGAHNLYKAEWIYHNTDGPLSVEDTYQSDLVKAMINGGEEIGWPLYDYNAPVVKYGVSPMQSTCRNGRRFSTGRAFLSPASKRTNLDVAINALVTKILINEATKTAYGVTYEKDGEVFNVRARKEVIICAGAINSPQLLMLSGIGPTDQLRSHDIKVLKNLPGVGQNLKDHICFYGLNFKLYFDYDQTSLSYTLSLGEFVISGKGPYSTLGGVEGLGFIKTNITTYVPYSPDIEYMFLRGSPGTDHEMITKDAFRLLDDLYDFTFRPLENEPVWGLTPILLHPFSTGEVKLRSKDPHDPPMIYCNYFSDPDNLDIKRMIAGIRYVRQLENTKAFRIKGAKLSTIPVYGCQDLIFDSDEYWECALRTLSITLYHQMGTCKMGPKSDNMAVVDNELKVYGINNLRVVDASIFSWMSGHTNAPCIMAGEKVSDIIKKEYNWNIQDDDFE